MLIIELKINLRNNLVKMLLLLATIAVCFESFYILPKDQLIGNSIAFSSWITQMFIIVGVCCGIIIAGEESSKVKETLCSVGAEQLNIICKIEMAFIESVLLMFISVILIFISFINLKAYSILYIASFKYIIFYWIMPFGLSCLMGIIVSLFLNGKMRYIFGSFAMIFMGPMMPTILEPLMDTRTSLYKYISVFNTGTLYASRPINLMFGYYMPIERIVIDIIIFIGLLIIILSKTYKKIYVEISCFFIGFLIIGVAIVMNFNFVKSNYDYDTAMNIYNAYSKETTTNDINNDYKIKHVDININNARLDKKMEFEVNYSIESNCDVSYITFMLYHGFSIKNISINNQQITFSQKEDLVKVNHDFNAGKMNTVHITYVGIPILQMYYDKKNWILPSYFAWYPMKGTNEHIVSGNDIFELNFFSEKNDGDILYKVSYQGKGKPISNLNNMQSYEWEGYADGVTLMSSLWIKELNANGNKFIVPILCKNYETNIEKYDNDFSKFRKLIGEHQSNDKYTYFFVSDVTYIGHGEKVNVYNNHSVVEITKGYCDGSMLSNPNIGLYALIDDEYLKGALDENLKYIYKGAYITMLVNQKKVDKSQLVRSLNDIYNLYVENAGYSTYTELVLQIQKCMSNESNERQQLFMNELAELIKNNSEIDEILDFVEAYND